MATLQQWVAGARPRTLPAAIAPVAVGTGLAAFEADVLWVRALLALLVALALQVGVNYANDYSDGIRGTDGAQRVGPVRLVGQQLATPPAVRAAALSSFVVAAVAGMALVALTGAWWLLAVGALAILAAWTYTGGPRPYGYAGLGEVFVLVFFGFVAVGGTAYVQTATITVVDGLAALGVGLLAVAILVVNNLRDIPGDTLSGKRTLAVRLGDARTRGLYTGVVAVALLIPVVLTAAALIERRGAATAPWAWPVYAGLAAVAVVPAATPLRLVRSGALGRDLIPVLVGTGRTLLIYGLLLGLGLALS